MKRIVLGFVFVVCVLTVNAQKEKRINYNKDWKAVTDIHDAAFYRIVKLDNNNNPIGEVCDYYITGQKEAVHEGIIKLDSTDDHNSVFSGDTKILYSNGAKAGIIKRTKDGNCLAERGWYSDGNKWYWVDYKDGKKEGMFTYVYENNGLESSIPYTEGKREGLAKWYYSSGVLREEANYSNDMLQGLDKRYWENGNIARQCIFNQGKTEGKYEEYFSTGVLKNEIVYVHDNKEGLAKEYYESGKIFSETNYVNDTLQGQFKNYYENGNIKLEINYVKNKREGISKSYYSGGNMESEWTYAASILNGPTIKYWPNGKVKEKIIYANDTVVNRICQDSTGSNIGCIVRDSVSASDKIYTIVQQMPKPPFDVNVYLNKNIKYPKYEQSKGVTGTVFLNFIVEKDGSISNVKALKGIENGPGLDAEAIRVIQSMPAWKPGMQNGKLVRVSYNIPIRFVLQ